MPITLTPDAADQAKASLRQYFSEELEQDLSDLRAHLMLEFVVKEIGPSIYNAAIADAQAYFRDRTADLEGACYEREFAYWSERGKRRPGR